MFKNVIEKTVLSHAVKLITGIMMLMMTLRHVEEIVTLITTKIGLMRDGQLTIIFVIVLLVGSMILVVIHGVTTQKE